MICLKSYLSSWECIFLWWIKTMWLPIYNEGTYIAWGSKVTYIINLLGDKRCKGGGYFTYYEGDNWLLLLKIDQSQKASTLYA